MRLLAVAIICTLIPPASSRPCERDAYFWHICGPITEVGDVERVPGFHFDE